MLQSIRNLICLICEHLYLSFDLTMPSKRQQFNSILRNEDRDLRVIQAIVLTLLTILLAYAACLIYKRDWQALLALLPQATAACAAALVAKTANRLLTYNMLTRADDKSQENVRCIHHTMALVNDLRNRVAYIKLVWIEGNRPLGALKINADVIDRRHQALYDRELYRFLPGDVSDAIEGLSGSIFGLLVRLAGMTADFENKSHHVNPPDKLDDRAAFVHACEALEVDLDRLFSRLQELRYAEK